MVTVFPSAQGQCRARFPKLGVPLGLDEVDLAQVGPARVRCDPGAVPHGGPGMGALYADSGEQHDLLDDRLAESVVAISATATPAGCWLISTILL